MLDLNNKIKVSRTSIDIDTSVNPITQPARYAVLKAAPKEVLAAVVVRQLENVAIFIPNAPQNMDVIAPVANAIVVYQVLA